MFKGIAGAPSLTHQPGALQLHRGGKKRSKLGRAALYQKISANSVHAGGQIKVRGRRARPMIDFNALKHAIEKKTSPEERAKIKQVMDEWKAGKLHSGSKKGPIVESQDQAIAIALNSINKRLTEVLKLDPYHDDQGQFTSADAAVTPQGSREQRKPRQSSAGIGYEGLRATGEAGGYLAGSTAGEYAGAALGTFLGGPVGGGIGLLAGRIAGGFVGDKLGGQMAQFLYSRFNPNVKIPEHGLVSDLASTAAANLGSSYGGKLGETAGAAIGEVAGAWLPSAAQATAQLLGTAAGDVAGTRFGSALQDRVKGVIGTIKSNEKLSAAYDIGSDVADEARSALRKAKRISFPPRVLRNDINDMQWLRESPAVTRFRTYLLGRETETKGKAARMAMYGPRPENLQPKIGESRSGIHQRMMQVRAAQDPPGTFPWKPLKRSGLFGG